MQFRIKLNRRVNGMVKKVYDVKFDGKMNIIKDEKITITETLERIQFIERCRKFLESQSLERIKVDRI